MKHFILFALALGVVFTSVAAEDEAGFKPLMDGKTFASWKMATENTSINLYDLSGKWIQKATIFQGSTIAYLDVRTLYDGVYVVQVKDSRNQTSKKITILK